MRRVLPALLPLLAACIVPQDIEEMEPPREGNDPPRIVQRVPAETTVVTQRASPCAVEFSVVVQDFDREDALEVRWFVDYGPDDTVPDAVVELPPAPELTNGLRNPASVSYRFEPRLHVTGGGGYVVVEAVVSDGFDPAPGATPENRAVRPGRDVDVTSWKVVITEEECRQ